MVFASHNDFFSIVTEVLPSLQSLISRDIPGSIEVDPIEKGSCLIIATKSHKVGKLLIFHPELLFLFAFACLLLLYLKLHFLLHPLEKNSKIFRKVHHLFVVWGIFVVESVLEGIRAFYINYDLLYSDILLKPDPLLDVLNVAHKCELNRLIIKFEDEPLHLICVLENGHNNFVLIFAELCVNLKYFLIVLLLSVLGIY